jgi:excisionase family DNA binding protein
MNERPHLYTVHEVAEILRMHEETVRILLRSGRLKGIKLGPHATLPGRFEWRITDQALHQFLEAGAQPTAASEDTGNQPPPAGEKGR